MCRPRSSCRAAARSAPTSTACCKALYEQRPGFRPVAVAGISIGAITAAVLGGAAGDPIPALDTLWRRKLTVAAPPVPAPWLPAPIDRSLATFGNPGHVPAAGRAVHHALAAHQHLRHRTAAADARRARRPATARRRHHPGDRRGDQRRHRRDGVLPQPPTRRPHLRTRRRQRQPPPELPDDPDRRAPLLGRRPVLQHPARPGDQRAGAGRGRRPRRRARAHRRRAVPDAGRGAAHLHRRAAADGAAAVHQPAHARRATSSTRSAASST